MNVYELYLQLNRFSDLVILNKSLIMNKINDQYLLKAIRKIVLLFLIFVLLPSAMKAQKTVTGTVKEQSTGETLPGVTVMIKGSTTGTVTDMEGKYLIKAGKKDTLVYSFIGYEKKYKLVGEKSTIHVFLEAEAEMLDEVVVTALGIRREKKSLGYSVQEMKTKEIESIKSSNMSSQLAGKIAGLRVTTTNGGPGSSTGLVLRGLNSLKDNQALVVIDGIPVTNITTNTSNEWGGKDYGNGIGDLNPEDIESISVLKGANASALYGSKALNGVILVNTKRGKEQDGIGVTISSTVSKEYPYFLYEMQDIYGAGRNGQFRAVWDMDSATGIPVYNTKSGSAYGSWGPEMQGQKIIDWDGKERTFSPHPGNYKKVYDPGTTLTNNIALDGGNKHTTYRFSYTNLNSEDIVPNTTLDRNTLNFALHSMPNQKVEYDFSISYMNQKAENRLGLSNEALIPRNYIMMPRHISDQSLKESMVDEYGNENVWYTNWGWMRNPYWVIKKERNDDTKDRILANSYFKYNIFEKLSLKVRGATDFFLHDFNEIGPFKGIYSYRGAASNSWQQNFMRTGDFLVNYHNNITGDIAYSLNFGGMSEHEKREYEKISSDGGLIVPNFYNPLFSEETKKIEYNIFERQLNSLYGFGQLSYKSICFLDVSLRNDWSSTLPVNSNSYSYPSASLALVYSELFSKELREKFSFGKLRFSYAQVGGDADPYKLNKGYYIPDESFNGLPFAYLSKTISESNLKPEEKISREIGAEFYFFMNRIALDVTYYDNYTKNQVLDVEISQTAGANYKVINAGEITNNGIEVQLRAKPVKTKNFGWDIKMNWAKNTNKIVEMTEDTKNKTLREHWNIQVCATEGHPVGTIMGYGIKRDGQGRKLVDATGLYIRTDTMVILGNAQPDWIAGFSNSFRYKNITLFAHVDISMGGDIFAGSNMYGYGYSGNFKETLDGREEWYESERAREEAGVEPENWKATGGIKADGVFEDGTPNDNYVSPHDYWDQFSSWTNEIHEPFVYDASYVKLREVSIAYDIPSNLVSKLKLKGASISVFGRNLWLIYSNVPNIDPEASYTNDLSQGLELYSYPTRRSFGMNLRIKI